MKRNTSLLLGAMLLLGSAATTVQAQDVANHKRYAAENKILQDKPMKGVKRVVFFGNSITEGWYTHHVEFFQHPGYICRGIGGQTSYQYLGRFRSDVIDIHADVVIINAGTNDIAENGAIPYNEDLTMGNIMSMVELAQANGIKVILTATLPTSHYGWAPQIKDAPEKIISLNKRIKAYAESKRLPFVDYFTAMVASDGRSMDARYRTAEPVHPTRAGYLKMEELIQPAIEKILK